MPAILDRLKTVAGGPDSYNRENPSSSNRPRNTAFELLVAAHCAAGGLPLLFDVGTVDVATTAGRRTILIECKRPHSMSGLASLLTAGDKQLARMYQKPSRLRYRGVVAIDLTRVMNPAFKIETAGSYEELQTRLSRRLDEFNKENESIWKTVRRPKTIAIILRFSTLGVVGRGHELNLASCTRYVFIDFTTIRGMDLVAREGLSDAINLGAHQTMAPP
jgi:hypothetical protein